MAASDRYPPQALYVIGTEGAERFSFYGLAAILTLHMTRNLKFSDAEAVTRVSIFNALVYVAPLLGGWIADRYFGRYRTILWVSLGYVAGHGVLAAWDGVAGVYVGCLLIALGAGGIKPNVSAFMGDQFGADQRHLVEPAFGWFYFSVNVGSSVGIFIVPAVFESAGPALAFAVPGVAMAIALAIYVAGRRHYRKLPSSGPTPDGFWAVAGHALVRARPQPGQSRLAASSPPFAPEAVDRVRVVLRIAAVFALISVFWALYFQNGSSWVIQAERMDRKIFGWTMSAGQVALFNAVFVVSLIPVMNRYYRWRAARGRELSALRKMTIGMYIASLSFAAALIVQIAIDRGGEPHVLWVAIQYLFLSLGEVLVSVTGLEFAYTQAPPSMRSVIMGCWYLCISAGSALTAVVAKGFASIVGDPIDWQLFFGFFFVLLLGAAIAFTFVARWYAATQPAAGRAG